METEGNWLTLEVNHAARAAGVVIEANCKQLQVQQRQRKNPLTDATQATLVYLHVRSRAVNSRL